MPKFIPRGLGWRRDLPDARDYSPDHEQVAPLLSRLKAAPRRPRALPAAVDLRGDEGGEYFPPVEDQGAIHCSPAFAVLSLIEYFERRSMGRTLEGSRLFLYRMARKVFRGERDAGVGLRATLKALVRFGAPPEVFWPYDPGRVDARPRDASLFGYARDYATIRYLRLDRRNGDGHRTLTAVKSFLSAGFPIAFGFSVPSSLSASADIPYRPGFDSVRGGQAVVAVGYDESRLTSPRGALLVRCSWGKTGANAAMAGCPTPTSSNSLRPSSGPCCETIGCNRTNSSGRPASMHRRLGRPDRNLPRAVWRAFFVPRAIPHPFPHGRAERRFCCPWLSVVDSSTVAIFCVLATEQRSPAMATRL